MRFEHTYTRNNYENMFRLQYLTLSFKRDIPLTVATWLEADMFSEDSSIEIIVFYFTQAGFCDLSAFLCHIELVVVLVVGGI